jgi:acylphosphatase
MTATLKARRRIPGNARDGKAPGGGRAQKTLREPRRFGFIMRVRTGGWGEAQVLFPPVPDDLLRAARDMKRSRMQIFYSGRVQGVGFRYTVRSVALGFEVTGTVRNLADGRVELVAEGFRDELEAFRGSIWESGLEHFIRDEQVIWAEAADEFRGFEIAI